MATGTTLPRAMSALVPRQQWAMNIKTQLTERVDPSASIYEYTNQRGAGVLC